jgi:hypothetical protein
MTLYSAIIMSVITLNVVMLSVVMLNVLALVKPIVKYITDQVDILFF